MPALTNLPYNPMFDLPTWKGQRQATFKFQVTNSVTGQNMGEITPLRTATLAHDTGRVTKRQLSIGLGVADTAAINPVQDRIQPFMLMPDGSEWPLGTYMFTGATDAITTSGNLGDFVLNDEMFLVDQQLEHAVGRTQGTSVIPTAMYLVNRAMDGVPVNYHMEASTFVSDQSWSIGSNRGGALEDLSLTGDWFSPWFDNHNVLRFIRTFDPAKQIPDFNWDNGFSVLRSGITKTNNLLTVANRYIVIANATSTAVGASGTTSVAQSGDVPVVGTFDVPSNYPYSILSRGFVIPQVSEMPVYSQGQAQAIAQAISIRNGVYETLDIATAPDPRHDSYNVIRWQGDLWLELSWSLRMVEGGEMRHRLRKAYSSGVS